MFKSNFLKIRCNFNKKAQTVNKAQGQLILESYFSNFVKSPVQVRLTVQNPLCFMYFFRKLSFIILVQASSILPRVQQFEKHHKVYNFIISCLLSYIVVKLLY